MITVEKGKVILKGTPMHLCFEATTVLGEVYRIIKENTDKDFADAVLTTSISHLQEITGADFKDLDIPEKIPNDLSDDIEKSVRKILEDILKND